MATPERTTTAGGTARRTTSPCAPQRWTNAIVAVGELAVLGALGKMDWASRVDDLGRVTFNEGPTSLLLTAALASLLLALLAVATRWQRPRWLLLATTLVAAVAAVAVALSRIVAANNTATVSTTTTSYELGAVVGVGAACVGAGLALVGVLDAKHCDDLPSFGAQPAPDGPAPLGTRPHSS